MNEGKNAGFLALSIFGEQTRIAGVWLKDPSIENRRTTFQLARDAALRHTTTSEIIAGGATEAIGTAAAEAGMRLRGSVPVYLFRKGNPDGPLPLQFQLCDNDAFFLGGRRTEFLT